MSSWRARLSVAAVLMSLGGLFIFELPIRELLHQRSEIAATAVELDALDAQNRQLSTTISSLGQKSVIAAIAHANYGLIFPGQSSYVVLPGTESVAGAANTLGETPIPQSDLMLGDVSSVAPAAQVQSPKSSGHGAGLFGRTLARLEFWRWAF